MQLTRSRMASTDKHKLHDPKHRCSRPPRVCWISCHRLYATSSATAMAQKQQCSEADDHVQEATIDLLIDAVLQALGGRSIIALLCNYSVRSELPEKRRCNIAVQWWQKVFAKIWQCCQRNNGTGSPEVSCRATTSSSIATRQGDCTHCESVICMQPTSGRRSAAALLKASRHGDGPERHSRPQGSGCRLLALLRCPGDAPQRHVCQSGWPAHQSS